MGKLLRSKFTLFLIFILMGAVAVYLNITAETLDIPNIAVTCAMFFIVLLIFIVSFVKFSRIDSMISDFEYAENRIRNDFKANENKQLWDYYRKNETLFNDEILDKKYSEYRAEVKRLEKLSGDIYRSDIEDFINGDLIDSTISRNVLNLVSGTMTGLGILGTFIGLSIGLQNFSTGTADEISMSISPLIQGIKVAFYTSIYGMVFSLIYSFIYKNKIDDAYEAMDRFLDAYQSCVIFDSKNESFRQLLEFEKIQAEGMHEFATTFTGEIAEQLEHVITPQFDRMNSTISNFASVATKAQLDGLDLVVTKFVESMNRTLANSFTELRKVLLDTVSWQKEDREYMRSILQEIGAMGQDLVRLNELSDNTVSSVASYVERLKNFQESIDENMAALQNRMHENADIAARQQSYIRSIVSYEQTLSESADKIAREFSDAIAALRGAENQFADSARTNLESVSRSSQRQIDAISASSREITVNLDRSAKNLSDASKLMGDKYADSLKDTMDAFNHMQQEIDALIYATDSLRRNVTAMNQLKNS